MAIQTDTVKELQQQLAAEREKREKSERGWIVAADQLRKQLSAERERKETALKMFDEAFDKNVKATQGWAACQQQLAAAVDAGRTLAMLVLQSDFYDSSPDIKEATDAALETASRKATQSKEAHFTPALHHPSCSEHDQDLVWHCNQCGLNESAVDIEEQLAAAVEALTDIASTLGTSISKRAKAKAALAKLGESK